MIDYDVPPLSIEDIRCLARSVRTLIGQENKCKFPVILFFERVLPELFPDYKFLIVPDSEMIKNAYAITCHQRKYMKIRESVYVRANEGVGRDLFTIAHEIGHLFMHNCETVSFTRVNTFAKQAYRSAEWQANQFAAELLMPYDLIKDSSIEEIVEKCCVSTEAARIRYMKIHR